MATQAIFLELKPREVLGKGLVGIRQQGFVPAVIHDHGKPSLHVMGEYVKLAKVYEEAGKHHPLNLELDGKQHLALIKDVDYEPVKHRMRHVVFQAISQNESVEAEVPLVLEGDIPAEKAGFMVITGIDHVMIEALPRDLPDELKVDATVLAEIGDKITVADIKVPTGVTIKTDPDQPIATIEETKAQVSEEETEEAAEEGEETTAEGESESGAPPAEE